MRMISSGQFVPGVSNVELKRAFEQREWVHLPEVVDPQSYFGWASLNHILEYVELSSPRLRLVGGEGHDLFRWSMAGGGRPFARVDAAALHRELKNGATLVLDQLDRLHENVSYTARGISGLMGCRVQANLYASFVGASGFGAHRDSHDVLVIQLEGSKEWVIGEGANAGQIRLNAGDALYMPEGTLHDVSTPDAGSMHVTFAVPLLTYRDLFRLGIEAAEGRDLGEFVSEDSAKLSDIAQSIAAQIADQFAAWTRAQVNDGVIGNFVNLPLAVVADPTSLLEEYLLLSAPEDSPDDDDHEAAEILAKLSHSEPVPTSGLLDDVADPQVVGRLLTLIQSGRIRAVRGA